MGAANSFVNSNTSNNKVAASTTRPSTEVTVMVRGTFTYTRLQANGTFELALPRTDAARTLVLDISGSSVMDKSAQIEVPAFAELVSMDTTLSGRPEPIALNLDTGGELMNLDSPTRTRVTVPPNAFQFPDGTAAVADADADADADVSITEIDIQDLYGDSAWAPNLVDEYGVQRNDLEVTNYTTTARIPLDNGPGWHNEPVWSNTVHMTEHNNEINILANLESRQELIENTTVVTGFTTMELILDKLVIKGTGQVLDYPIKRRKILFNYNGDNSIVFTISVDANE